MQANERGWLDTRSHGLHQVIHDFVCYWRPQQYKWSNNTSKYITKKNSFDSWIAIFPFCYIDKDLYFM